MTNTELKNFEKRMEEFLFKAHQSGKQETSGLVQSITRTINAMQIDNAKRDEELKHFIETATEKIKDHEERIRKNDEHRIRTYAVVAFLVAIGGFGSWMLKTTINGTMLQTRLELQKSVDDKIDQIPRLIEQYYEVSIDL